jgi:multiple sugar transport system ATP-binding protein
MNLIEGRIAVNGGAAFETAGGQHLALGDAPAASDGKPVIYGIRPEHLRLDDSGFPAEVVVVEPMGSETHVIARLKGGGEIIAALRERRAFKPGETLRLAPDRDLVHLFDKETELRL